MPAPREAVAALCGGDAVHRIDLSAFDLRQTELALRAALGGSVVRRTAEYLHARSGGNILFLRELVLGALAAGARLDGLDIGRHRDVRAVSELATGRNTPMTGIQSLYAVLFALGILVSITIALTLTIEGAGALYLRDQLRLLLERTRVPSPTRTPSTGAAQQQTPTEDARVLVLR